MKLFDEIRPATVEDVAWLRKTIRRELRSLRIQADLVDDIQLAIAELATNTVVHASRAPSTVGVRIDLVGASLRIEISDDGAPFEDFADKWDAASRKDFVASGTSGLGLALAHASLRAVSYTAGGDGERNRFIGWRPLQRQRPTILLVDDDPTLLRLYTALLKGPYRILAAESVETALAIAQSATVDLILSDYHLGEELGIQLLSELERDAQRLPVPVIMLSSDRNVAARASADGFGIEMFLYKPVKPKELRTAVERALVRSGRRLAGLFRYFAASVERLLAEPDIAARERMGIAWRTAAATAGGGDFVLYLPREDRDRIVLVDVMGHGLKAKAGAIAFASLVRAVNGMLEPEAGPGTFLGKLSGVLKRDPALCEVFATLAVVDRLGDGAVEISSAAHPAPVLVSASGVATLEVGGPLIGLLDDFTYPELHLNLAAGERLLLTTDGIEPKFLAGGGSLPDGLIERLATSHALPLAAALDSAADWALASHGPSPRDDWTLMLLEAWPGDA